MATGCQILIGDGLRGTDDVEVPVKNGEFCKTARIGRAIMDADVFISLTHFKGHEMTGFGGAINNEQCLQAKREDPRRCYFFAGLVHPCADPLAHIQTWLQRGADGVKLIETKPTVYRETGADLSSPAFEPLFDFLERSQTPILWHVGDPATFWHRDQAPDFAFANGWFYGDGGFPSLEALYGIAEAGRRDSIE